VTAGSQSITVNDTVLTSKTGSANVTVAAADASQYVLQAPSSATAGVAFSATLTAKDQFGNVADGYRGTAHFSGGGTAATLPTNYTFTATDAGVHTFTNGVTLTQAGLRTITAK